MKSIIINDREYYFYITVCFNESAKRYYYISLDTTIKIGDSVVVETNDGLHEVRVVETKFYSAEEVPFPIEHTKLIIAKIGKKTKELNANDSKQSIRIQPLVYRNEDLERKILPFCEIENGVLKGIRTCGLSTIHIPPEVTEIESLTKLKGEKLYSTYEFGTVFEGEYECIQDENYESLVTIRRLYLPPSVKSAHLSYSIEDLYLSDGIEKLLIDQGYYIDMDCLYLNISNPPIHRLKKLTIPRSLIEIDCPWHQIKEIVLDQGNPIYKFKNGLIFRYYENDVKSMFYSKNILQCTDRKYDGNVSYNYEIVWRNPNLEIKTIRINENVIIPRFDILEGISSLIIEEGVEFIQLPHKQFSTLNIPHIKIPSSLKHIDMAFDIYSVKRVASKPNSKIYNSLSRIVFETVDLDPHNECFSLENGNLYWYNSAKTDFLLIAEKINSEG